MRFERVDSAAVRWFAWSPRAWTHSVTVLADGEERGPWLIEDETIPVDLPDDYVGQFEVHLLDDDGARLLAGAGRRLPPRES